MYEGSSSRLAVRTVVHEKGSQLEIKKRRVVFVSSVIHSIIALVKKLLALPK